MSKPIVLQSHLILEIGKIYTSARDPRRKLHPGQRFKVIRESNIEEWIVCMESFGEKREDFWEQVAIPCPYHYEVEMD